MKTVVWHLLYFLESFTFNSVIKYSIYSISPVTTAACKGAAVHISLPSIGPSVCGMSGKNKCASSLHNLKDLQDLMLTSWCQIPHVLLSPYLEGLSCFHSTRGTTKYETSDSHVVADGVNCWSTTLIFYGFLLVPNRCSAAFWIWMCVS